MSIEHYENFPVASLLCPRALRPPVVAIYHFARTADDIADEGTADTAQRLADLADYRNDLRAVLAGKPAGPRWPQVFGPLAANIARFHLPAQPMHDLLDAFEQDAGNPHYVDRAALMAYCSRSANPVGRLLMHLYGIGDAPSLQRSDAICSALQLINFWQDLGIDSLRGRHYVPLTDLHRHAIALPSLRSCADTPSMRALVRELCDWAEELMRRGAPLALRLPGRSGWELRLVVQGGLRILEKIRHIDHATMIRRPKLGLLDPPLLAWRALQMREASR